MNQRILDYSLSTAIVVIPQTEFMTTYYMNNVYLLFLPAYTSHVLQPLDLGCFSSLKTVYRCLVNDRITLSDTTKVGKATFLEFYARARETGTSEQIISAPVGTQQVYG